MAILQAVQHQHQSLLAAECLGMRYSIYQLCCLWKINSDLRPFATIIFDVAMAQGAASH